MDILIKNIEMPKKGQYLQILIDENGDMSYKHAYYDSPRMGFKLHKYKAITLPEHGDLIERDKLPHYEIFSTIGKRIDVVDLEDVKNAPTVLEAST